MSDRSLRFKSNSLIAFNEEHWQKLNYNTGCFEKRFSSSKENYRDAELERQRAYLLRNKSLMNLEKLLVDFETRFKENGGIVLWARDADDARDMIWDYVNKREVHGVARSNSTTLDEIEINEYLDLKRIPLYETSIARFILKAANQGSYHPVFPTLNLSKEEINGILNERYKLKLGSTTKQMVNFIRHQINHEMDRAQVCLTGASFLLADVGGIVLIENEGNVVKSCASAKAHIIVAGIDKVISSMEDLSILFPLTSAHATGREMTAVNTITTGPVKNGEGPEQTIVILLDNGRTDLLENEVIRQSLSCIQCGACISVCPIYKNIGGISYETPYIGPIGTVMSPLMYGLKEYEHFASLCSLCGRCTEVCPVKIPIEDLMIENRRIIAEKRIGDAKFEALIKTMIGHCKSRKKMDCPLWLKKLEYKQLVNRSAFTKRTMPEIAQKSFNQMTKKTEN